MFTGIVEEIGVVKSVRSLEKSAQLVIEASRVLEDVQVGDSISTNGVCLTVTAFSAGQFIVDAMPETMRRTNLGLLKGGSRVNLERALRLGDRLGGHLVNGHIDGTGRIQQRRTEENAVWFTISAEPSVMRYIVEKGSVTLDGISLTVVQAGARTFDVSVIPHTRSATTIHEKQTGDILNIETDILAKYIEKLSGKGAEATRIDMNFLTDNGY
jgi:riboflavin synthase